MKIGIVSALAILGSASPALADSWIIYGTEKPDKTAMLLDEKSIVDRSTKSERIYDAKSRIVFEITKDPDQISLEYRVYCNRGTLEGHNFQMLYKNGRAEKIGTGELPEHKPADFSEEQVLNFICANPKDREAGQFIPLREAKFPVNYVRNVVWMDAKDLDALTKSVDASINAVTRGLGTASGALDSYNHDMNRQGGSPVLESWLGRNETDFVAAWGDPGNWADIGSMRELYYSWGGGRTQIFQGGNLVGEQEDGWCAATIYVKAGKIWDYRWDGTACRQLLR